MKLSLLLLLPMIGACRSETAPQPVKVLTAPQLDRQQLVLQPKPGWKPGAAPRKLNIMLLTSKTRIRKGEACSYRLEAQNAGSQALVFKETSPSFIKDGSLCGAGDFKLYATPPSGQEVRLPCKPGEAAAKGADHDLDLTLLPGEYLLTRGFGPAGHFRELSSDFHFEIAGIYRLKAVYAPSGGYRAVSNTVTLEVVP